MTTHWSVLMRISLTLTLKTHYLLASQMISILLKIVSYNMGLVKKSWTLILSKGLSTLLTPKE